MNYWVFLCCYIKQQMATEKTPKNPLLYNCEKCDFKCSNKKDYNRHLLTRKHNLATISNELATEKTPQTIYTCENCNKKYINRTGLWRHKKICPESPENKIPENKIVNEIPTEQMIMMCFQKMQESQAEAQAAQMEAAKEQTRQLVEAFTLHESQIINNTTNNTTNNNQFNLNVFLNEDCKDAYTLKDVINTIECTVTDLDRMDKDGYAATVVRKIMESIQDMSITERPIHCTDARRNTVCVKNETGWERNEAAMKSLNNSVYKVGRLLGKVVDDWRDTYPEHFRGSDSRREQYHRLITNILKVTDGDVEARIASKVCKGVVLDRKAAMENKLH
jgi:hypothetical protein